MPEYISREAAISKIRDEGVLGGDYDAYEREEDVVNTLKSIPAADVVERPRWIPVTERLPSPMRAVLVYAPYRQNIFMAYVQGNKWYVWGPDEYCCQRWPEYHAITHWMPLPPAPEPIEDEAPAGTYDLLYEEGGPDA